ncbi:MAG: hypothetical protein Q6354_08115, partial [Candidatus Brocadiales bacterium]|nr:hypothetical protein [Candidatus Brocadiales bacterium]
MIRRIITVILSVSFLVCLSLPILAAEGKAPGPPSRPPGWDKGKKEGWEGDVPPGLEKGKGPPSRPPGWDKGKKEGWGTDVPPGLEEGKKPRKTKGQGEAK